MSSQMSAYALVDDVPWGESPVLGSSTKAQEYLDSFAVIADRIPVGATRIPFAEDMWDFNPYFDGINDPSYVIPFAGLPEEAKTACKFYALDRLRAGKKVSTVSRRLKDFKGIVACILEKKGGGPLTLIAAEDVVAEIEGRGNSPASMCQLYTAVLQVARFIAREYEQVISMDLETLRPHATEATRLAKEVLADRKTADIPAEYFDAILRTAVAVMRDGSSAYNRRATACLIVMLTQLGLRINDLLAIRVDQLHRKRLSRIGREARFIRYRSRKPSKPGGPMIEFEIFSNPLCTEAFETLLDIRETCVLKDKGDFLYLLDPASSSREELPVPNHRFRKEYSYFFADELPDMCRRKWEGVRPRQCRPNTKGEFTMYVPQTAQYRVHVCTVLYERNVPLLYVQRYMGHLSEYMVGYYARPRDATQESIRYAKALIRDIIEDDARLLGGTNGDELKARILEKFVAGGEVSVANDVGDIVKAFGGEVTIRAKTGGVCITSQLMDCSRNKRTDVILCAYNLCPNLFHLYHMADVSYADFLVLQGTYEAALGAGRVREAQKELNKLKDLCRRRLLPELDELDREIALRGEEAILERHVHLADIIANEAEIRREAESWMSV